MTSSIIVGKREVGSDFKSHFDPRYVFFYLTGANLLHFHLTLLAIKLIFPSL